MDCVAVRKLLEVVVGEGVTGSESIEYVLSSPLLLKTVAFASSHVRRGSCLLLLHIFTSFPCVAVEILEVLLLQSRNSAASAADPW